MMASKLLDKLKKQKSLFLSTEEDSKKKSPQVSTESRTIYVNTEIPSEELDDYGQPITTYISNHIHTAKYTWYTFLPKNLFEQFRGIANLYFLFLVIIQMFPLFSTSASPVLVVLPLAAILVLTGAKDAFEDNKRRKTDESVNKAITWTLSDWKNINIPQYKVARWKRLLGQNKTNTDHELTNTDHFYTDESSSSSLSTSLKNTFKLKKNKPYRPGKVPHTVLQKPTNKSERQKKHTSTARKPLDKRWRPSLWQDLTVGDFVCLRNDDSVPADILVLSTSEQDGLCYVETQNLDGETNLKIMRSLQATNDISTPDDCKQSKFYVECEPPHANLYTFNGALKWRIDRQLDEAFVKTSESSEETRIDIEDAETLGSDTSLEQVSHEKTEAITASSVLLRGCVLRNTGWVIGLVLFTGNETKIMLNSGKTPSKRSKMEKATNPYVNTHTLVFNELLSL